MYRYSTRRQQQHKSPPANNGRPQRPSSGPRLKNYITKTANMAEKTKAHSAGIFADMTVDGPEIGTLVIIVDRAKNLPNRKSIGKQDPYCAARLGKEAKKTNTDRRGGQTPKW